MVKLTTPGDIAGGYVVDLYATGSSGVGIKPKGQQVGLAVCRSGD